VVNRQAKGPSKAKLACQLVDAAMDAELITLFTSAVDEMPYVQIKAGGCVEHLETHAVKGGGFSKYLRRVFWEETREPLYGDSLSAALAHAEMRALLGGKRELYARVAHLDGTVVVDAGDESWGAYEITSSGWNYVSTHPVPFVRSRGTAPFPEPVKGKDLLPLLKQILKVDEETAQLLACWVVCTYCAGPYIILVLHGEQGSGKTTAARVLRALSDPSSVPLRSPPRESRDLVAAARASHVIAYDNLSSLAQWTSDALSSIATGGGYEARQLFTDLDEVLVQVKRPVLLNGIENPAISADLLDRSLVVAMKPIVDEKRRSEEEIDDDLERLGGELVGAVFAAVSSALANEKRTARPTWARMVDATRWALASAKAIGSTTAAVEKTLKQNRLRRDELVLEASVFATAMLEFAIAKVEWEGTTAELKAALEAETEIGKANASHRAVWPQSIQKVVAVLAREAPILRRQGVEWRDAGRRSGIRVKTLTYRPDKPVSNDAGEAGGKEER
jgi:hypothetical protein